MTKRTANLTHISRRRNDAHQEQLNVVDALEQGLDAIEFQLDQDTARELSDWHSTPANDPLNWGRYAASRMHDFGQR